jgi:hypothetical protein
MADLRSDLRQFFADWNALLPSLEVYLRAKAVIEGLAQPNGLPHFPNPATLEGDLTDILRDGLILAKPLDVAFVANQVLAEAAQPESPTARTEPAEPVDPEEPPPESPEAPDQGLPRRRTA